MRSMTQIDIFYFSKLLKEVNFRRLVGTFAVCGRMARHTDYDFDLTCALLLLAAVRCSEQIVD